MHPSNKAIRLDVRSEWTAAPLLLQDNADCTDMQSEGHPNAVNASMDHRIHHRGHTALGGRPPIEITNLAGQHI
jgi:hypothetical protein